MQQINLFAAELKPKVEPLRGRHFFTLWCGLVILLVLITSWHGLSIWSLQSDITSAEAEIDQVRLANANERATHVDPKSLEEQVQALHAQQLEQIELAKLLRTEQQTAGFSAYLTSLGRARVDGLWLSEIRIAHQSGRQITLKGATVDALNIPELLQNLATEAEFAGQRFEHIDLTAEAEQNTVEFAIISPDADRSG